MQPRITFSPTEFAAVYRAMSGLGAVVKTSELESGLVELVKLRVSQMNGCGYCIDMHTKHARAGGETEQRLYLLQAWREAPLYSDRERAALAWAEALTTLAGHHVPDDVYAQALEQFGEQDLMSLTLAVVEINGWNRFAISFNAVPGTYRLGQYG